MSPVDAQLVFDVILGVVWLLGSYSVRVVGWFWYR